jgi:hypothetical protein
VSGCHSGTCFTFAARVVARLLLAGIGGDLPPKRDMHRFVKWPKYVRIQRQRRVLNQRLKVGRHARPSLHSQQPACMLQHACHQTSACGRWGSSLRRQGDPAGESDAAWGGGETTAVGAQRGGAGSRQHISQQLRRLCVGRQPQMGEWDGLAASTSGATGSLALPGNASTTLPPRSAGSSCRRGGMSQRKGV